MIGRVRNYLFRIIAILFVAKFIIVSCALDNALDIRDSWNEEIDGHRRYPEEYGELRVCHVTNLSRVSEAHNVHGHASHHRLRRFLLLIAQ